MVGRRYGNRVKIVVLQQLADVMFGLGSVARDLLDFADRAVIQALIHIAKIGDLDTGHFGERLIVRASAAPEPDNADVDRVAWRLRRSRSSQPCSQSCPLYKISPTCTHTCYSSFRGARKSAPVRFYQSSSSRPLAPYAR